MAPVSVPDTGSRPVVAGAITLPGQSPAQPGNDGATSTTPVSTTIPGSSTNPTLLKIEQGRNAISVQGDQLIKLGADRDLAKSQAQNATDAYDAAETAMVEANANASQAATDALMQAAAMPPGAFDSGLGSLSDLARLQQGDTSSSQASQVQAQNAEIAAQVALNAMNTAKQHADTLSAQYDKMNSDLAQKQKAQQTLESQNSALLAAAEASENTTDSQLGANYLSNTTGQTAGQGADPRAVTALNLALTRRGDPYVWSTEGPNTFDCSGLMYWAYRQTGFDLERVSRDQYWQTRDKVVDRYSLLPGDLLFFSYTNSWTGIHHVAMYAGNGMMVEAPRTGLDVRLVPVRWSRLFQATRVYGAVPGGVTSPQIGSPDPDTDSDSTKPSKSPQPTTTTKAPTNGGTKSPGGTPSSGGSTSPSNGGSTSPSTGGSTSPSTGGSTSPSTGGSTPPGTGSTTEPSGGSSTTPSGGGSSSSGSPDPKPTDAETTKPAPTADPASSSTGSSAGSSTASTSSTHSSAASTTSSKTASDTVSSTASDSASASK